MNSSPDGPWPETHSIMSDNFTLFKNRNQIQFKYIFSFNSLKHHSKIKLW